MAVSLAGLPLPWSVKAEMVDFGGDQTSHLGGVQSRFIRIGTRWAATYAAMPALGLCLARQLLAARILARTLGQTVVAPFPQPAFETAIGAPVFDGAGQAGGDVLVRGLTAGVTVPAGVFFSVPVSGRGYLYQVADAVTADGTGRAQVSLAPWIRAAPADAAALNFATPTIEGFIDGATEDWTLDRLAWFGVSGFRIQELE